MNTLENILKIARLLDQTGESRPNYLHDEKPSLGGQHPKSSRSVLSAKGKGGRGKRRIRLRYETDAATGDVRLVQY